MKIPLCLLLLRVSQLCVAEASNNKILFLTNSESGLGNVFLATSYAIAVKHPEVEAQFASFQAFEKSITTINEYAQKQATNAHPITFHELPGNSFGLAITKNYNFTLEQTIHAPGVPGYSKLLRMLQLFFLPWTAEEYLALYRHLASYIEELDPAIIVLDTMLAPALDVTRNLGRKHVVLSPNCLKDQFAMTQSWGAGFWKYPVIASGYDYPVPWSLIPANIWLSARLIWTALRTPGLNALKEIIHAAGLPDPTNILTVYRSDVPFIVSSSPLIEYPLEVIPENVTAAGPIYLSTAPVSERDPELATWLAKAPTVLVNLGSSVSYSEVQSSTMANALVTILTQHDNVQILWKYNPRHDHSFNDDWLAPLNPYLTSDRLRMPKWITADPASLLESGHIILSVHHGGANCFMEAIATGIPAIVLPMWADLYDYAVRVEWLGVGIWGSRRSAPDWETGELVEAFSQALGNGSRAQGMRTRAKDIAAAVNKVPGRDVAAQAIVDYMHGTYRGNVGTNANIVGHGEL